MTDKDEVTPFSDNTITFRLGLIVKDAYFAKAGDPIDNGCALVGLLNIHGFTLFYKKVIPEKKQAVIGKDFGFGGI